MQTAFAPAPLVTLPIKGSEQVVPVRRIYCVGKNYAKHAAEMGSKVSEDAPFFFTKHPEDVVLSTTSGANIPYPAGTDNLHFEVELVVVIGKTLTNVDRHTAREAIFGYAVGIDLTKRDLQQKLKAKALPWALSKSFTNAAVISNVVTGLSHEKRDKARITLEKNGARCQNAILGDMARDVETLLVHLSTLDTLHAGDLLFTGTPAGVGRVTKGDTLLGKISHIGEVSLSIRN